MRKPVLALLMVGLGAGFAAADNAKPRDGSAGGSSAVGARHHGGSPGASSVQGSGRGGGSQPFAVSRGDTTPAQRRHPRPGSGSAYDRFRGYRHGGYYGGSFYGGYPYYGYYYPRFFYPRSYFYFGYDPFWWDDYSWGYWGAGYYPRRYRYDYDDRRASIRLMVQPEKARVFVDGYYAGTVDDFNGMFQRLYLSPGRHDVVLKLDGYRTHRFKLYAPSGQTIKLRYEMNKGVGDDPVDEVAGGPVAYERAEAESERDRDRDMEPRVREREGVGGEAGRIRFDFRPDDATVYIDGGFRGTARQVQTVELPPGRHRIEVVHPGYRTYEREVEVREGESKDLRFDLERR